MSDRGRILLIGGLAGSVIGLAGAWLYLQNVRGDRRADLASPAPADMARLGLSILAVLQQITAWGRSDAE